MKGRKEFIDRVCERYGEMLGGGPYPDILRSQLEELDDKAFLQLVEDIENDKEIIPIVSPNFSKHRPNTKRNLELGEKYGYNFFRRIWIPESNGVPAYLSPNKLLICHYMLRRQAQLLAIKISIPEHNRSVDDFTGQATGASKGSRISHPELQVLTGMDLFNCLKEFTAIRGGDNKGFNASNAIISKTGGVSLKSVEPYRSGVESTKLLHSVLIAMMLENTLLQ